VGRTAFSDGSAVVVEPEARLALLRQESGSVDFDLAHGRVRFDIQPGGPRRWTVRAGPVRVRVLGTSFSVERSDESISVAVHRGVVEVEASGASRRLYAGERFAVGPDAEESERDPRRRRASAGGPGRAGTSHDGIAADETHPELLAGTNDLRMPNAPDRTAASAEGIRGTPGPRSAIDAHRSEAPFRSGEPEGGPIRADDRAESSRSGFDHAGADRAAVAHAGVDRNRADGPGLGPSGADRAGTDDPGLDRAGVDRAEIPRPETDHAPADRAGVGGAGIEHAEIPRPETDHAPADRAGVGGAEIERAGADEVAALLARSDRARRRGDLDEAATALEALIQRHPDAPEATSAAASLGRLEQSRGRLGAAARAYARALELDPPPALAELVYERLVRVSLERGAREDAERWAAAHHRAFPRGERTTSIDALLSTP
jgi:hypothetical protein